MTKPKRIYLAGPEVFFPHEEHNTIVAEKKRLLREAGYEGIDPLDTALTFSDEEAKPARGSRDRSSKLRVERVERTSGSGEDRGRIEGECRVDRVTRGVSTPGIGDVR